MIINKRGRTALCAAALFVILTLLSAASVFALPSAPLDHSVYDEAGVLSEATISHIAEKNRALYAMTGAEIAVVVVRSTGFEKIEDYSRELFADWGIGSADRSNGVLLIVSAAKNEYYALQGAGIADVFSDGKLKLILTENMAPSIGAGDIETGVIKTYDAMYSFLESVYGISAADWDGTETYTDLMRGGAPSDGGATSGVRSLSDKVFGAVKIMFIVLVCAGVVVAVIAVYSQIMCAKETRRREEEIMRRRAGIPDAPADPGAARQTPARMKNCGCPPQNRRPQPQQRPRPSDTAAPQRRHNPQPHNPQTDKRPSTQQRAPQTQPQKQRRAPRSGGAEANRAASPDDAAKRRMLYDDAANDNTDKPGGRL